MNWNQDLKHPRTTQIAYRGQNSNQAYPSTNEPDPKEPLKPPIQRPKLPYNQA